MKKEILPILLLLIITTGCLSKKAKQNAPKENVELKVGGDRDEHGCIGSAGYSWSVVKEECIRPFETGVKLTSATDPNATSAAFIVFGNDSLQVELFLPDQTEHPILDRRSLPNGGYAWNVEDDDTKNVRQVDGKWIIEQRGKKLYQQE